MNSVKTRMQCMPIGTYSGPLECVTNIVRKEGLRALYKGASPPAIGWAITDAILLGSLVGHVRSPGHQQRIIDLVFLDTKHNYRLLLAKHTPLVRPLDSSDPPGTSAKLSVPGHAVSFAFHTRRSHDHYNVQGT